MEKTEPITFSPNIRAKDPHANYWLRQVTVRLRREICWIWYERGVLPEDQPDALPPMVDKVQASLDMSRFWEVKVRFFQSDPTALYLTNLLEVEPPQATEYAVQGSFGWVLSTLDLDNLSAFILALGLAAALDNAMGNIIAVCLNNPTATQPNLALVQGLWHEPDHVLAIADPMHQLFRYGLIQFGGQNPPSHSEIDWNRPFIVPSLVANQLLFPDAPIPPGLATITTEHDGPVDLTDNVSLVATRLTVDTGDTLRLVPIRGPKGSAHVEVVQAIAKITERNVFRFNADPTLLLNERYLNALATLCWLKGADVFLGEDLVLTVSDDKHQSVINILPARSLPTTLYLGIVDRSQIPNLPDKHLLPIVDVPEFSYNARVAYWKKMLEEKAQGLDNVIAENARRFRYGKETINTICEGLQLLPDPISATDFVVACRAELELDIGELAQRVVPRFHNEKLILPHKQERQFQEVINAMHSLTEVHYGWGTAKVWNEGGISALFAGPPGTGKTMGAEILAIRLDLPMYRIDLSQVVNKYIGETEKNLKRLFDTADMSDIILFFDEADSLFGKRTEVKDAHDRYANLEISYLLERMERFKGLAILATNRKKDLDEAFLRRLRYIIDFPLPGKVQREKIWRQVIPKNVDTAEVDFTFLARQFRLAGGHIRSIIFNACLQSADGSSAGEHGPTGRLIMKDIIIAVKREYEKLNRPIGLEHFGPYTDIIEGMEHAHETS